MSASPAKKVLAALKKQRLTLSVAESCTGGLVSHLLTNVEGSSAVFKGSVVAYSNDIKKELLKVKAKTLSSYGAVSGHTAREMAEGVRRSLDTRIGAAITGIAGPGGGTTRKPVGTVYIAFTDGTTVVCKKHLFVGTRLAIKRAAAKAALEGLADFIGQLL